MPSPRRVLGLKPALATVLLAACAIPASAGAAPSLRERLAGNMRLAGSASGAYVYNATDRRTIFRWRYGTPRILASNTKLFTTAAALARFGTAGTLGTEVRGVGT